MKQVKITAITASGMTITSGWFNDMGTAKKYMELMLQKNCVVVKLMRFI